MMNIKKYDNVFLSNFSISKKELNEKLVYSSIEEWDSIGHMNLISELEEVFDISLEMDDIIDFSSYVVGIEIIKKYGVDI